MPAKILPVAYKAFLEKKLKQDGCDSIDHLERIPSMPDLMPLRIHARVFETIDDDEMVFRWSKDERNHQELQRELNEFYANVSPDSPAFNVKAVSFFIKSFLIFLCIKSDLFSNIIYSLVSKVYI